MTRLASGYAVLFGWVPEVGAQRGGSAMVVAMSNLMATRMMVSQHIAPGF